MSRTRRLTVLSAIVALAVAASASPVMAQAAPPPSRVAAAGLTVPAIMPASGTRGFWVHNYTSKTLKLVNLQNRTGQKNRQVPGIGTSFEPGTTLELQLDNLTTQNDVNLTFDALSIDDQKVGGFDLQVSLDWTGIRYARQFGLLNQGVVVDATAPDVRVFDPANTRVDGTKLDNEQQSALVSNLCEVDEAICRFTLTKNRQPTTSRAKVVGELQHNSTCDPELFTVEKSGTRSLENSWSITASAEGGVEGVWKTSLSATYAGKYEVSSSFKQVKTMTLRKGQAGWFTSVIPVWRYTGTYVIDVKNTVWAFNNVTVDSPRPEVTDVATVASVVRPLSPQEKAAYPDSGCES
ncbi:MAG: hypothetical protein ABI692_08220 [Terracoccus sp.]